MHKGVTFYLLIFAFLLLSACGGGGNTNNPALPQPSDPKGLLIPIANNSELLATVRSGFNKTVQNNLERTAVATAPDSSTSSFTTTYTLEANVDEHDIVKYNGDHLFIAPSRSMDCCFVINDLAPVEQSETTANSETPPDTNSGERRIRIVATEPESAGATEVGSIKLSDKRSVEGLYTHKDQLAAISSSGWWGLYGDSFARASNWQGQTTAFNLYDISDITAPSPQMQIQLQGGFVSSRKQGDTVYLIARHTPNIEGFNYYPSEQQSNQNQRLLNQLTAESLLPKVTINGTEKALVEASDCLVMDKQNTLASAETGYPTMTLIVAIDLAKQTLAKAVCHLEYTDGIYVSDNAIYLTQVDSRQGQPRTLVHRYNLSQQLNYQGSGAAEGALYLSGNRDFRINQYGDHIRLVTTQRTENAEDRFDHRLTILKLNSEDMILEPVATLPNRSRPEALGKPNEDLYGVRFFGDTAYLVTFERIDPLYVLDLSTPTDPLIAGALEVPGFSDFLHPINDSLLMGLGQDENNLVKLELFNVADINAPYSLNTLVLGKQAGDITLDSLNWSYSEARYNRHAFTYQAYNETTDRFAVPATLGFYSESAGYYHQDRLFLLEINGKNTPNLATIDQIGYINADKKTYHSDGSHRSRIHGDSLYFINGTEVWSTLWTNPTQQQGPL